jgi:membrane-bound metal-dependent hydrolase YbcI (DUF457 family)
MPTPVGHVIGGIAAGWIVAAVRPGAGWRCAWREAALFGVLGASADFDLLFGAHRGPTHSIAAAVLVGAAAWMVHHLRGAGAEGTGLRVGVACFLAYGSHALLDWLGRDTSPPIGVMALWPFNREYYESGLHLFMAVSRRYHQGWVFIRHNLSSLVRELAILVPLLALVMLLRTRRQHGDAR